MIKNLIFGPCFAGLRYKNIVLENHNFIIENLFSEFTKVIQNSENFIDMFLKRDYNGVKVLKEKTMKSSNYLPLRV